MAASTFPITFVASLLLLFTGLPSTLSDFSEESRIRLPIAAARPSRESVDKHLLEFSLNLEFLQAEFFLWGATGHGLDYVAPNLTMGGPCPIGARRADLDNVTKDIITQMAYQEVGHLRAMHKAVHGCPRPLLDLSPSCFSKLMDKAFDSPLEPPFDPYANSINFLLASYLLPYVSFTNYVGICPHLEGRLARRLCSGLLGVQSAQDAIIRSRLYEQGTEEVKPYGIPVAEFTRRISELRNRLGGKGVKDAGIDVPRMEGKQVEQRGTLIAGDRYSISYGRSPRETLRIMYGRGTARAPGSFFPDGANGYIARSYLGRD